MTKDYYAILGVSRRADPATIHSAFRALARQYHPDVGIGSSTNRFREATEAYRTLSDPVCRRQHDFDLETPTPSRRVVAEPLFDPAMSPFQPTAAVNTQLDAFVSNLMRVLEAEFDLPFFSRKLF
jgi:curved DNA-binding protein CbpA